MNETEDLKAIQIIGTQRSGSNLLRVMLNQLPGMFAPHPPHVFVVFYPLLDTYGDLQNDKNFAELINDVCTLIELNPVPWGDLVLDRDVIFKLCRRRSLIEIFIQINELQCRHQHKTVWCCKSLETVYFIKNFEKDNFYPFIIYLIRDGRDVAVSFKKAMVGEKHIYSLATKWKQDQEEALKYIEHLPKEQYIIIKYEEFTQDPAKQIQEICKMTGLTYAPEVMNYYESEESKKTAESGKMWENVTKPVLKNNSRKYLSELSEEEIKIFEAVAGDILKQFGYPLEFPGHTMHFTAEQIAGFEEENRRLKKLAAVTASPEDIKKRQPQSDFIARLKKRLIAV